MIVSHDRLDALVFTGGVGEHQPRVRQAATAGLGLFGLNIDHDKDHETTTDADVSGSDARCHTVVITAREDLEIARQVRAVVGVPDTGVRQSRP